MRWHSETLDVKVAYDDFERAREEAIKHGEDVDILTVPAEVDIEEALKFATIEQLRDALKREEGQGYTNGQLDAIRDCFASLSAGDTHTASAVLTRIFDHPAQIAAAEEGMELYAIRREA